MGVCAAPEIRATLDRLVVTEDVGIPGLMATFGEQIGKCNFIAQVVDSVQEPYEDRKNYLTRWALMQVMAGLVTVDGATPIDGLLFSIQSLRDCTASLAPYYSGKLAAWQNNIRAILGELRGVVRQITTHSGPQATIKKKKGLLCGSNKTSSHIYKQKWKKRDYQAPGRIC